MTFQAPFDLPPNCAREAPGVGGRRVSCCPAGQEKTTKDEMTMSDVAERVKKIVVEHLGVDADKVKAEASFIDDLGADSLDTV